jgi:hypothetical protein
MLSQHGKDLLKNMKGIIKMKTLTKKQSERFKELKKDFEPFAEDGWMAESPDTNRLCFFKFGQDDEFYVVCDFTGKIKNFCGVTKLYAQQMVNAYLPAFLYANFC